jgi:TM2 domain-containing membrane protein YozV
LPKVPLWLYDSLMSMNNENVEEVRESEVFETPAAPAGVQIPPKPTVDQFGNPISPKSRLAAALLAWFVGVFGIHRFYVGKVGTGLLMLVTLGGLGIWALIDFIVILVGSFKDKEGRLIINWS